MSNKFFIILLFVLCPLFANSRLSIDITAGNHKLMPVVVVGLNDTKYDIQSIIENNFNMSGVFITNSERNKLLAENYHANQDLAPNYEFWRSNETAILVAGDLEIIDNIIKINFKAWDIYTNSQIYNSSISVTKNHWRRGAHIISDFIYKAATGDDGYFDTKIVYVAETGNDISRATRLAIMDQDGANIKFLTDGKHIVLTPRFSSKSREVIYMSYSDVVPTVHIKNLETGDDNAIAQIDGMSSAPRFSSDDSKTVMAISKDGATNIYSIDMLEGKMQKLTHSNMSINTSPSFSPDNKYITFNSDRSGVQNIYIMNNDGTNQKRISFGKGSYATPVWSPSGRHIAFTKIYKGKFYIGIMKPNGTNERILSHGYLVESPSWSPNGKKIIFTKQFPKKDNTISKLYVIDTNGKNEYPIYTTTNASNPAWSPILDKKIF